MRNEALVGYLLHQRSYQEKRAIYYLFSQEHGVVHGIGKKGAPLFELLQLFATGKRDLKTFSQLTISHIDQHSVLTSKQAKELTDKQIDDNLSELVIAQTTSKSGNQSTSSDIQRYGQIQGQQQYAALYLNEILWKLLPSEDPMPVLWQHYQDSLSLLKQPLTADELRLCLRQFEQHLFKELGFALILSEDSSLEPIDAETTYRFLADTGFMPVIAEISMDMKNSSQAVLSSSSALFSGKELLAMIELGIVAATLNSWSRLNRQLIDQLLDYQPLQSRLLWQQHQRYQ